MNAAIEVIDLGAHKAHCLKCRALFLCEAGRRIAERQATAIIEGAKQDWRIKKD